jgi:hypothetical protein
MYSGTREIAVLIEELVWRPANVEKLAAHGIRQAEVDDLVANLNYIIFENPGYADQVLVIGYTGRPRWLTVAMEELGGGRYRPVTGWPSHEREIRRYLAEE